MPPLPAVVIVVLGSISIEPIPRASTPWESTPVMEMVNAPFALTVPVSANRPKLLSPTISILPPSRITAPPSMPLAPDIPVCPSPNAAMLRFSAVIRLPIPCACSPVKPPGGKNRDKIVDR